MIKISLVSFFFLFKGDAGKTMIKKTKSFSVGFLRNSSASLKWGSMENIWTASVLRIRGEKNSKLISVLFKHNFTL